MCFFFSLNGKFLMLAGWPILGALSRLQEGALDSVEGRAFDSVTGTGALIVEREIFFLLSRMLSAHRGLINGKF